MKIKRRIISAWLAVILCMTFVVTAFADTATQNAGIYVFVNGSLTQSSASFMATTTTVKLNPDRAYLRTTVEYKYGDTYIASNNKVSSRGDTSLVYSSPILIDAVYEPNIAFCAHDVYGGTSSEQGYAAYTMETLNLN